MGSVGNFAKIIYLTALTNVLYIVFIYTYNYLNVWEDTQRD